MTMELPTARAQQSNADKGCPDQAASKAAAQMPQEHRRKHA
jgi:hypothetical protein